MPEPRVIEIRDDGIRLGQLLKLAGLVDSGADVKQLLAEGAVEVNGAAESRRSRQLNAGDLVACNGEVVRVVTAA